jgi:hypothetical protein
MTAEIKKYLIVKFQKIRNHDFIDTKGYFTSRVRPIIEITC